MTRILAALLAIAVLTAFGYEPPKPRAPAMAVTVRAAGTTLWVKWTLASSGGPDSTTVDVTGPTNLHRKYTALNKTDSIGYVRPALGDSIGGSVTATSWRRLLSASAIPVQWGYREPDVPPPPPSVTVQIVPASFSASPGQTIHFTVTVS